MKHRRIASLVLSAAMVGAFTGVSAASAVAAPKAPSWTKNCTALNKTYPHGVGKAKAKDKVRSKKDKPVTNFKKSDALYNQAMKYNRGLDRDKDGIACEKH